MKKIILTTFTFLTTANLLFAQNIEFKNDSVKRYIDKTFSIIQNNALNKNKINWDSLKIDIYERTKNAKNIEETLPIYPYLFEKIEDHHGWLTCKNKNYRWNKNSKKEKSEIIKDDSKRIKNVYAILLNRNIGYLRIPGNNDFGAKKMDSIASNIVDEINKINTNKIKGWTIDLRINTGGNMYPMIAGISDLIGDNEKLGGFVTSDNQTDGQWFLKNGNFYVDSNQVLDRKKLKKPIEKQLPIAIIISGYTASSGEMTAISLIGRNKTKLFGEESAGYTTTNEGFKIDENSGLNLAVGYVTDRTGKIYVDNVKPDFEIIGGDDFANLKYDKKIIESINWLKKEATNRTTAKGSLGLKSQQ